LALLPTPEGIDALAWAVHDPNLAVERAAASALGRIDDPRAHAAALALLRDGSVNK
jgi:HEAT repeat protein